MLSPFKSFLQAASIKSKWSNFALNNLIALISSLRLRSNSLSASLNPVFFKKYLACGEYGGSKVFVNRLTTLTFLPFRDNLSKRYPQEKTASSRCGDKNTKDSYLLMIFFNLISYISSLSLLKSIFVALKILYSLFI